MLIYAFNAASTLHHKPLKLVPSLAGFSAILF